MKYLVLTLVSLFTASLTFGTAPQTSVDLAEGEGKTILEATCASCHALDVLAKREGLQSESWKTIVEQMRQYGASLTDDQSSTLVGYLADNFGEGRKILDTSCTTCHGLNEVKKFKGFYKRDDWQDVVTTMVKYGANVKEPQVPLLVDYLTRTYSPKN